MTAIRHFTSGAIVLDDQDRVLLIHHNRIGLWLYPGGHVDPDEDPAEAAIREVQEETGLTVRIVGPTPFHHPTVRAIPAPFAIMEMPVSDERHGPHHHIDFIYVCRPVSGDLNAQLAEVADVRWTPIAELERLEAVAELPDLVSAAVAWADRWAR